MTSGLTTLLETFDGRNVAPFREAAALVPHTSDGLARLLTLAGAGSDAVEVGATWLVKHLLEQGVVADLPATDALLALLPRLRCDDSVLHALQCLPLIELDPDPEAADALYALLLELIEAGSAFVRAWAYNGLGLLAARNPERRDEVRALFERAQSHESAAVKARIRHASRALGP